jgi:hypothetical protein
MSCCHLYLGVAGSVLNKPYLHVNMYLPCTESCEASSRATGLRSTLMDIELGECAWELGHPA